MRFCLPIDIFAPRKYAHLNDCSADANSNKDLHESTNLTISGFAGSSAEASQAASGEEQALTFSTSTPHQTLSLAELAATDSESESEGDQTYPEQHTIDPLLLFAKPGSAVFLNQNGLLVHWLN